MRPYRLRCLIVFAAMLAAVSIQAQEMRPPNRGGTTKSLGIPPKYHWFAGAAAGLNLQGEYAGVFNARLGVYKSLLNPAIGVVGLMGEGYAGTQDQRANGGLRASLTSPFLRLAFGADYDIRDKHTDFLLTFFIPGRRGGILGHGSNLRLEWIPNRDHTINLVLTAPFWSPNAGKTRPRRDYTKIRDIKPEPVKYDEYDPVLEDALENLRFLSHWINRLTTPYLDQDAWGRKKALEKFTANLDEIKSFLNSEQPLFPDGVTSEKVIRRYHEEFDRVFSIAISGDSLAVGQSMEEGRRISARAKEILLEEVILPYNRTLGEQRKKDTTTEMAVNARGEFVRWVLMDNKPHARDIQRWRAVGYVFVELLEMIEEVRKDSRDRWSLSQLVWLPFQLVLLPEQHDSQEEIDQLIERAVKNEFTPGNYIWYLRNEKFQLEFARMVQEAEDYHVLWIHDYRGVNSQGKPDLVGFEQTKGYLKALIKRVRRYDQTGKLPVYMIIIDQIYWEDNKGRIWSELLEDPLNHKFELGEKDYKWMEEEIAELQKKLRVAVAESNLLQTLASQYGRNWLENQVKVHINITNPSDPTFRSRQVIPLIGFPDDVMRDHRKISFYDITEEDPYRGMAIYTGMGIGEHYSGPTWEDRAILAQGPALLHLKYAARELFLNQGFPREQIPYPLGIFPKAKNYDEIVAMHTVPIGGRAARAMEIHSETGYGPKPCDVAKAVLYTLMPKGSILKAPDSIWNGALWGGMLLGAALRGGDAFVIAPSIAAAPSSGFPQMSRAQELLERLLIVREMLGDEISSVGGTLRVGIYDPDVAVNDYVGRIRSLEKTWEGNPLLRELYDFHPSVIATLEEGIAELEAAGFREQYLVEDVEERTPKLHLKAQFFASRQAWEKLISRPEWADVFRVMARQRLQDLSAPDSLSDLRADALELEKAGNILLQAYLDDLTPEEREKIVFYIAVGAHNMNYRSFMMDGEVLFLLSYFDALPAMLDFIGMTGLCKWPKTREELNELIPPYKGLKRKIGRFIRTGV